MVYLVTTGDFYLGAAGIFYLVRVGLFSSAFAEEVYCFTFCCAFIYCATYYFLSLDYLLISVLAANIGFISVDLEGVSSGEEGFFCLRGTDVYLVFSSKKRLLGDANLAGLIELTHLLTGARLDSLFRGLPL